MRISIYLSNVCVSGGCVLYFWDWSIYRKFCKNWRISFLDDCRSIAAWVMEKLLREKIWEGNSAVEEFSTSIFTPLGESSCYGIADERRCPANVSVRAELHRRSVSDSHPQSFTDLHLREHTRAHAQSLQRLDLSEEKEKRLRMCRHLAWIY